MLTVILLSDVKEKFSSKFKSNNSILFLPALIVTFSKTEVFFLTSPFTRICPSSFNNLLKLRTIAISGWFLKNMPNNFNYSTEIFYPNDKKDTFLSLFLLMTSP